MVGSTERTSTSTESARASGPIGCGGASMEVEAPAAATGDGGRVAVVGGRLHAVNSVREASSIRRAERVGIPEDTPRGTNRNVHGRNALPGIAYPNGRCGSIFPESVTCLALSPTRLGAEFSLVPLVAP